MTEQKIVEKQVIEEQIVERLSTAVQTEGRTPVQLPIVNPIPQESLLREMFSNGLLCGGGFPLWLCGGSPTYHDIDIYATQSDWSDFYKWHKRLRTLGTQIENTPKTSQFEIDGQVFQLVKPHRGRSTNSLLIQGSDMSVCATILILSPQDELQVWALYPEDISSRTCHVLKSHEWINWRVAEYQKKGYTIVPFA